MLGRPIFFDFDHELPDADWIVENLIERGQLTVLAAAPGVGKSFFCLELALAIVQGRPFIGLKTSGSRVLYVDGENMARHVIWRLGGLGMANADREHLRMFVRQGVRIGEGDWLARTQRELAEYKPDLLILDTATSVLAVADPNNNAEVGHLMAMLRGLCENVAILLLHHERKPAADGKRGGAGAAMAGAVQWQAQADQHLSLSKLGPVRKIPADSGNFVRRYQIALEFPKNREGEDGSTPIEIVSEHRPDGKPVRTSVRLANP